METFKPKPVPPRSRREYFQSLVGERVYDELADGFGTIVESDGKGRFKIDWDDPTPHQGKVWVSVPYKWFSLVDTDGYSAREEA